MADKNYFEFLDIPDGSGGSDRWHAKDAEARESLAGIPSTYATKDELNAAVVGATAAELFTFEVDIATMQLHVYSTASYANAFKIEDGTLKIDLSAMPTT